MFFNATSKITRTVWLFPFLLEQDGGLTCISAPHPGWYGGHQPFSLDPQNPCRAKGHAGCTAGAVAALLPTPLYFGFSTAKTGRRPEAGVKYLCNKLKHLALWADASFYNNFHLKPAQYIFNEIFYKTFNSPQFISSGKWVSSLKWWAGFRLRCRYLRRRSDSFLMLFPLNNISFSFFFPPFFFLLLAWCCSIEVRAGTDPQIPQHWYHPSGPCRQTLPAQTDVSDCPLSNLLVGSAPNRICLSLPQFPHLLSATNLLQGIFESSGGRSQLSVLPIVWDVKAFGRGTSHPPSVAHLRSNHLPCYSHFPLVSDSKIP